MSTTHEKKVLVLTDRARPSAPLLAAIRARAAQGHPSFQILMPDPARAEIHLLHPQRHVHAATAATELQAALADYEEAARGPVQSGVSVRHDPFEAVEEVMLACEVDEIILSVVEHPLQHRLHHDTRDRLAHLHRPLTIVETVQA